MKAQLKNETKVITGKVRASYAHIFEPHSMDESTPKKYSVSLIIPKEDTQMVEIIEKAIENAKEAFKGKWNGKIPNNLKTPLRDGDIDREDDPNYENAYFINATSQNAPGVVSPAMVRLNEPGSVVSGDYIRAVINFYGYNVNGNKGIAAELNNIQLVEKGEPLGGASAAEDDFDELDTDDEDFL